jgi:tetratricopeptide (TPR) repeat protein
MSNLTKLLSRSNALAQQGNLSAARQELEKAVRDHSRRAEAWVSLAAVHGMEGNFSEALNCANKAVELAPDSLHGWVNLVNAAISTGDLTRAVEAFRHAHTLPGWPPELNLELGMVLVQSEMWNEALEPLRQYCTSRPGHRDATFAFANALARNDDTESALAILNGYCHQHPGDMAALTQLGFITLALGKAEEAWGIYNKVVAASPDEPDLRYLKGALLMFEARYEGARDEYEDLIQQQKDNPSIRTYILAAQACRQTGDLDAAVEYARTAVNLDPRSLGALTTLSTVLLSSRTPAEARKWMDEACAIDPDDPAVLTLKGAVLEIEGDKEGAWEAVRAAFDAGPIDASTATVAAGVAPAVGKTDEAIELLEGLVDHPGISVGDNRKLHFTLTQLCDKGKQYDRAFEHAVIANRLKNAWYDHNLSRVDLDRLMTVYSRDSVSSLPRSHCASELPVFIVGMPRSGTSLLEQILSCHSQVHARGETTDIGNLVTQIPYYPDGVRSLSSDKLDDMAEEYIQRLREIDSSATRFTDKMPTNYNFVGIISQLFPKTRIINCRRDPRDVCLSNFMLEFARGLTFTYDLESLAKVCRDYQELMRHWKAVLPVPILDVRYEELIADPEVMVRKVLDFCGLQWEDACMNFHKSKRHVVTASYDQVRQPIYKGSVARWKNYEKQLEPVSRILGLSGDSYP